MVDGYCEKCKYYVPKSLKAEMTGAANPGGLVDMNSNKGECYFNPPEVKGRPETYAWDFCSNFERAGTDYAPRYGPLGYRKDKQSK